MLSAPPKDSSTTSSNMNANKKLKVLDILIIGGGLSGVMVAHEIQRTLPSLSWKLLEARDVLGGRLANDDKGKRIDLGGAWVWPDHQPQMKHLLKRLQVPTFPQPDDDSSTRIDGGAVEIVHTLAKDLPMDNLLMNSPVATCSLVSEDSVVSADQCAGNDNSSSKQKLIQVNTTNNDGISFLAKRVVVAVPPRLVHKHVKFDPPLSEEKQHALAESHTWMAGVTKVSLVYPNRFWDEDTSNMGLPSQVGPAFQVYDASTKDGSVSALTFFSLVPPHSPANRDDNALATQVANQMATMWKYFRRPELSDQAQSFSDVHVHSWPKEKYISEDAEPTRIHPHPHPVRALSTTEWGGSLLFAGSETDLRSPGVMEGAVGAAFRVMKDIEAFFGGDKK